MVKKALLIGINYKGQAAELKGCIQDVTDIQNFLVTKCGYSGSNIRLLTDNSTIMPTRKNIMDNIKWLVSGSMAGDTLFFYYSGHGAVIKDTSGDESNGVDEVFVPIDYTTNGIITDDWMNANLIAPVPVNVRLWAFSDCCHSGTICDLKYNFNSRCALKTGTVSKGMPFVENAWTDQFMLSMEKSIEVKGNVVMFSGCMDGQTSADTYVNNRGQGAFTSCFLQFLNNNMVKQPDGTQRFKNGTVKLHSLLKELNCRLIINGYSQQSQLSLSQQKSFETTLDL
jgi:hypothetical protein